MYACFSYVSVGRHQCICTSTEEICVSCPLKIKPDVLRLDLEVHLWGENTGQLYRTLKETNWYVMDNNIVSLYRGVKQLHCEEVCITQCTVNQKTMMQSDKRSRGISDNQSNELMVFKSQFDPCCAALLFILSKFKHSYNTTSNNPFQNLDLICFTLKKEKKLQ